jgi:hypothetical protein
VSKPLLAVLATALLGTAASAAKAPVDITFEATRAGNVAFPHRLHAARGCRPCHPAAPAKLGLKKDSAHELCKGCHERESKGPVRCEGCHRR